VGHIWVTPSTLDGLFANSLLPIQNTTLVLSLPPQLVTEFSPFTSLYTLAHDLLHGPDTKRQEAITASCADALNAPEWVLRQFS
jgi:hypothetical protein